MFITCSQNMMIYGVPSTELGNTNLCTKHYIPANIHFID